MGVMLLRITSTSGRGRREKPKHDQEQVKETQKDRNTERQKHRKTRGRMCKAKQVKRVAHTERQHSSEVKSDPDE